MAGKPEQEKSEALRALDEILAPFRQSFAESGMTDEEFDALIEKARQDVWDEWHKPDFIVDEA